MLQVHGSRARARDILFDAQGRALEVSGDCSSPVEVRYRGAPDKLLVNLGIEKEGIAVAYIRGRCRKCDECLNHRRRLWTARAIDECAARECRCQSVRERSKQRLDLDGRLGACGSGGQWSEERDAHNAHGGQRGDAPQQVRQ